MKKREKTLKPLEKYGRWIPGEALYNPDISSTDKILFGLIWSLATIRPYMCCIASNPMMAEDIGVEDVTIRKALAKLEKHGYIRRERTYHNGIVSHRRIYLDPGYQEKYKEMLETRIRGRRDYGKRYGQP